MDDLQTISFYLLIFFISIGLCRGFQPRLEQCRNTGSYFSAFIVCLFISLPLIIISAFRDISVGVDTLVNSVRYNAARTMTLSEIFTDNGEDFLHNITLYFTSHLFDKPYMYFGLLQAFTIIPLLLIGVKYSNRINVWKFLAVYCFWYFNDSLNLSRQMIAVVFVLVSLDFLINKKNTKALILFLLGYGFHSSALMTGVFILIIYEVVKRNLSTTKKILIIGFVVLVFVGGQNLFIGLINAGVLSSRYNLYVDTFFLGTSRMVGSWISTGLGGVFECVFRLIICISAFVFLKRNNFFPALNLYSLLFFVGILIYAIGLLFYKTAYFVRFSLYFDIFGIYLLSSLDQKGMFAVIGNKRMGIFTCWISLVYWFIHVYLLTQSRSIPYSFSQF